MGAILLARASRSVILPSREMPAPHYLLKITDVTGHKSLVEMPKTYSRDAEAFVGHAGAGLL